MYRLLALFLIVLSSSFSSAQQIATTHDGKRVVLNKDGTWQFLEKKPLSKGSAEYSQNLDSSTVSLSLASRKFLELPNVANETQASGKIAVEIRAKKDGIIQYARAGARGTTLSDLKLWRKCEEAVLSAKLNSLESAPEIQIGTVVFSFTVR